MRKYIRVIVKLKIKNEKTYKKNNILLYYIKQYCK